MKWVSIPQMFTVDVQLEYLHLLRSVKGNNLKIEPGTSSLSACKRLELKCFAPMHVGKSHLEKFSAVKAQT